MERAIFLDRDGVICVERNLHYSGKYLTDPKDFEWENKSREGLSGLCKLEDFLLVMITGQSAIGRGLLNIETFHEINSPIYQELAKYKRSFAGVYYCPHKKEDRCECRKPRIGMLLQAQKDLGIDLTGSYVIEDKIAGIKMGKEAGCKTILVRTGYAGTDKDFEAKPDFIADNLLDAVRFIS